MPFSPTLTGGAEGVVILRPLGARKLKERQAILTFDAFVSMLKSLWLGRG